MGRISRGFRLLGASWQVLKADKELMVLPVLSCAGVLAVAASIAGLGAAIGIPMDVESPSGGSYVLLGVMYLAFYFVSIYFNAAVIGAAMIRLDGGDPTVRDGLRVARAHIGKIAAWAAVSATVGVVLRMLAERTPLLGRVVVALVGAAWSAVTFFVVPVLIYEPVGVSDGLKRSASLFKERWGEQFTGNASIGAAMALLAVPFIALGVFLAAAIPVLGLFLMAGALVVLMAAGSAMSAIFNAALYRYATVGEAAGPFTADDLRGAFQPRRR